MSSNMESAADPAAIFAAAKSLWDVCDNAARLDTSLNLSDAYSGMDQLMREVMRIGEHFETWACRHIDFEALDEIWPYLLEDRFGAVCLDILDPDALAEFNDEDCLRVAIRLGLRVRSTSKLPVPIDMIGKNPIGDAGFEAFRIQSLRNSEADGVIVPFTAEDDPFDSDFGAPFFGIYGFSEDKLEHIADRESLDDAITLVNKLAPGIVFDDPS